MANVELFLSGVDFTNYFWIIYEYWIKLFENWGFCFYAFYSSPGLANTLQHFTRLKYNRGSKGKSSFKNPNGLRFGCDDCSYSTTQSPILTQHWEIVHKVVFDFVCNECQDSFKRQCNLVKHGRTKHSAWYPLYGGVILKL